MACFPPFLWLKLYSAMSAMRRHRKRAGLGVGHNYSWHWFMAFGSMTEFSMRVWPVESNITLAGQAL